MSSNAELNWFAAASAAALQYDLAGSKAVLAKSVESLSAAQAMQASRALEGYFFERGGRIQIHATLEDLGKTKAVQHFEIEGPVAGGFLPLVNQLARRLDPAARAFSTRNESAFQLYGRALQATGAEAMENGFASAAAADPTFAAAYLGEARVLTETGERDRALAVVRTGEGGRLDSIDRANFQYVAAASGNPGARVDALESLVKETPADAALYSDLGALQFARRDFPGAVRNYQAATRLNPEEPGAWNQLGYAFAWRGNLTAARQAIQEYQKLSPDDVNAIDSLGEVSYFLRDFESAAKYFEQAGQKSPAEFVKAAEARLMAGDPRQADALFAKYAAALGTGQRGRVAYQTAGWQFLTGRRMAAMSAVEKLLPALSPDEQALALSQLAVWKLETGDSKAAMDLANQAAARAQSAQTRRMAAVSRFVAAGPGEKSGSALVDALALLFARDFRGAEPLLRQVYEAATPSDDGQVRVLLAWARLENGDVNGAAGLLEICPLPLSSGDPMFASFIFPRYLALRAEILAKQGKQDEARKNHELYLKYGGETKS